MLKIDVEGAELKVLYGCAFAFSEQIIKSIQIEVHHNDMRVEINLSIKDLLAEYSFVRVASVRHAFGNFTDDLYVLN